MTQSDSTSVVWFRRDLRLDDNPAWNSALRRGGRICALFVADPRLIASSGSPRVAQMRGHLESLDRSLRELGGALRIEVGDPSVAVPAVLAELGAGLLAFNADTTPYSVARDRAVGKSTTATVETHWGTYVQPPGSVLAGTGRVSRVFTPFHRTWDATAWVPWVEAPQAGQAPAFELLDSPGRGFEVFGPDTAEPPMPAGETAAWERVAEFDRRVDEYSEVRDFPALDATSGLSVDLRFGVLSPRRLATHIGTATAGRAAFVRQLAWRDWYAHLLAEVPHLVDRPLDPEVGEIDWINDPGEFEAWCQGRTGYPIVDAGMRELLSTGRMHNRVRMIVASFLVKDLLVDWRWGERWFRRPLLDADVSQNVGNWQWAAGTGPDSAPFFRVFNPLLQSRKFDGEGTYIRHWVPELAGLSSRDVHSPSEVGPLELAACGITLGETYPYPIVEHAWARDRALEAYGAARAQR